MNFKDTYFNLWMVAWDFHKKYAGMSGNKREWDKLVEEIGSVAEKYKATEHFEFIKNLLLVVLTEIERTTRKEETKNE